MLTIDNLVNDSLCNFLRGKSEIDERLPECPDIENLWENVVSGYIPDGAREFNKYPSASLGWMFFIGMALAQYWDTEWNIYSKVENIYTYMRDKRDYDHLDEYICQVVLQLDKCQEKELNDIVSECAEITLNILNHQNIEPATKEAFMAYVACLHQLYIMGMSVQLHRLGYHMTKI